MKTAIVHDLVTTIGGADNTLQSIYTVYPSPVYTLVAHKNAVKKSFFKHAEIITSFIQKMPWGVKKYRAYLPLYPIAIEQFDLRAFDVILSSSFIVAKGLISNTEQLHICYMHNPIRPAWELYHQFLSHSNNGRGIKGFFTRMVFHYLRLWDVTTANRVDHFIANSKFTARRIKKIYGRESVVIYPPVDVAAFPLQEQKDDYYITASRLVYHKRIDVIVKAFQNLPDKKLYVIGDGPELKALQSGASKNVFFMGYQPQNQLVKYLQRAKAFIFAANEDFGIAPIEAMACGTPVLAYKKGGSAETVAPLQTGMFFARQTADDVQLCINAFEAGYHLFDAKKISAYAQRFSKQRFETEYQAHVQQLADDHFKTGPFCTGTA
ncbi:glycosyltransferase [Mucilaginibacter phyllosphaerae]|uniref:Glycosyltransferase family 4 protein n=1 Tax=Mucilaginibacter phyllosphaerae TaxID=1812349 RepID=A0A4Y8A9I8_9SPHI|nr:glycosyltransferase [Mucilaginibacter phyllosphaerae]MBB3969669.1 glycosyltransferase involved in cell wall biosynthesis [Mucilaginibacter phyllosphaerae]TEW65053.1 glycosyltransferase family 4 protein [Mucilaginibacter phyllosphaerae]GGH18274.1 glycosyl transferase [Mucilaginibacter phyllosphaerae]